MKPWKTNLIMAAIIGSRLYGTDRPDSDIDIRGVCFPTPESLLGLTGFKQFSPSGEGAIDYTMRMFSLHSDDVTIYSLSKFFTLCLNANPNILELLFIPGDRLLKVSLTWYEIIANRHLFLSTKIVHSFAGYAYSQLQRLQRHKRWLDDTPTKPDPHDYGLVSNMDGGQEWSDDQEYNIYQAKLKEWQAYAAWRKNRNPARAELERLYNYDTKYASHLYRLIFEAEELLTTGYLTLPLKPDMLESVLAVLHGEVEYEAVVKTAQDAKDKLLAMEATSPLPKRPDRKGAERLLVRLQWKWLRSVM